MMKITPRSHARKYTTKRRRYLLLLCIVGICLLVFYVVSTISSPKYTYTSQPSVKQKSQSQTSLSKDVQLTWPSIGAAAIGSVEDGVLTRSPNGEKPRPTASMAKVITALAVMEKQPFKPDQAGKTYTLTREDVANYNNNVAKGGSVLPVYEGMVVTQYQALQMMLIASANNMADTLAERTFGSMGAYKSYAKDMLRRMDINETFVDDASGYSAATVSTPSDIVSIGIAALQNPVIAQIVAQPQAEIPGIGTIKNTNELLGAQGIVGIKTGTTNSAGNCLLFAAHYVKQNGEPVTIVGVVMGDQGSESLFSDSGQLLMSAKESYSLTEAQSDLPMRPLR